MKKKIILFALIFSTFGLQAQDVLTAKGVSVEAKVEVQEVHQSMSKGQHNSYIVHLPNADEKTALSVWKDLMKEYGGKAKKKSGEYVAETKKMQPLGQVVNVYAKYDRNELSVWFEADGSFVSSGEKTGSFAYIEELFNDYRFNLSKALAAQEVEAQEKALKDLEKDFEKLEKENKSLRSTIEKAKDTIAEAERGIEVNLQNQEAKKAEIEAQKAAVKAARKEEKSVTKFRRTGN